MTCEGDRLRRALVCPPAVEYARVHDPASQNFLERPDGDLALAQHRALSDLLVAEGVLVEHVPELRGHPNSAFVRDAALPCPGGFLGLRMGLAARVGEEAWMAECLRTLGLAELGAIEAPGTLEGGDVFLMGSVALVGLSSRANREGAEQLARLLVRHGVAVRTAAVPDPYFHLGSVLSPVGPDRVVCVAGTLPAPFLAGLEVIEAPEEPDRAATCNVLCLAPDRVLADATESPRTLDALSRAGVEVETLDLSEFQKGAGGPTCLVLPLER